VIQQQPVSETRSYNTSNQKNIKEEARYMLYDFNSEIVATGRFTTQTEIDVSSFKKGRYILRILTKHGTQEQHIIIE